MFCNNTAFIASHPGRPTTIYANVPKQLAGQTGIPDPQTAIDSFGNTTKKS
jgi:hypothetical protein